MSNIKFFNPTSEPAAKKIIRRKHKMLVVDDDESIHKITKMAIDSIDSIDFIDVELEVLTAYSAAQAKEILDQQADITLALLDVVMESPEAGLELVNYIRQEKKNDLIRLVMRTGQANQFPSTEIVQKYDINDFKEKTELTIEKLFITIRNSIKQYEQLKELKQKYSGTYQQLVTNGLTGAPNIMALTNLLDSESIDRTLILIDIVDFSMINEASSFNAGDEFLIALYQFLTGYQKEGYQVFHLNADRFCLAIAQPVNDDIHRKISSIYDEITHHEFKFSGTKRAVFVRLGVASGNDKEVLRKAELALKESKGSYVNPVAYYSPDLNIVKTIANNSYWSPIVRSAFDNGGFMPFYQPIINFDTGIIEKYELLLRLEHEGVIYTPDKFLCAIKHNGLFNEIFKMMFEKACEQATKYQKAFSVNILATDFTASRITQFIARTMIKHNTDPSLLILEILEDIPINYDPLIKDRIIQIKSLGLSIAIDDFGINCSNFGQLDSIPIDIIKIDGSFIKNVNHCKNSQIVLKTIKTYAQDKNIELVAEYVCNREVFDFVKQYGIKYGQGYHIGKPLPEVVSLALEHNSAELSDC